MTDRFTDALKLLLAPGREGGFVNHPADPGGMTNLGVTRAAWERWVGGPVTEADMRALTPADVTPFYHAEYWKKARCGSLPPGLDHAVFDAAVNSGVSRAARWLQGSVGVTADGLIGPQTLKAVAAFDPADLIQAYNMRRRAYLEALPEWRTFGRGWGRRVAEVTAEAVARA